MLWVNNTRKDSRERTQLWKLGTGEQSKDGDMCLLRVKTIHANESRSEYISGIRGNTIVCFYIIRRLFMVTIDYLRFKNTAVNKNFKTMETKQLACCNAMLYSRNNSVEVTMLLIECAPVKNA